MIAWRGYNLNKVLHYKDGFMQEKSDINIPERLSSAMASPFWGPQAYGWFLNAKTGQAQKRNQPGNRTETTFSSRTCTGTEDIWDHKPEYAERRR